MDSRASTTMDWDKLRIFHAVADAGSFTHAGHELGLSQSAVSRQISALEQDLRVLLFHRHARGLILTEQGEVLYRTAHEVFTKLAATQTRLMDSKDKAKETLTSSRLAGQVKEIYEHEVATVEKFKVVMRSDGRRFTVTPRVIANMKSLHATNRLTRPPDLSSNYRTSFRYYKCPSGVIWCNGKSQCCMECRDAFQRPSHNFEKKAAAEVHASKPQMDFNCPYGSAWCNCRSLLCPNCLKDKGWSSQKEQRDAARALKTESLKELQARRSSAGKKPAAPGSL